MKYTKPTYEKETIETSDIIMISLGEATLTELDSSTAQVSASVYSILGLR